MPEESCCAILVAAGNSSRMGMGMSKQFLLLGGKPVIVHTLLAFERAASISSIVVVCRPEDQAAVRCLADQMQLEVVRRCERGRRPGSALSLRGLAAVPKETEYLAIHDGARPLIRPEEIDAHRTGCPDLWSCRALHVGRRYRLNAEYGWICLFYAGPQLPARGADSAGF